MIELKKESERVLLVGVGLPGQDDVEDSLKELSELAATAGAQTVGQVIQSREQIHPGTYVGKGKIDEIKDLLWELDATGIICDDELSPVQMKNLQDELDVKVMDRTLVILDIFAGRASTSEGKIQVELAQLKYRQTRLTGFGTALSRLGGGIGTRGPGEKKLEMDRRLIKNRIAQLNRELKEVKRHREVTRERRSKNHVPVVAIVGYTNAGKSTLLNALTGADILAEDQLFATLDPTSRALKLPSGVTVMMIDTVGLVRRLPHHLVEAFRSTLEEAAQSDIILNVCDASSDEARTHMQVTTDLLESLGCGDTPIITVLNKCDLLDETMLAQDFKACVRISAKNGTGIDELLNAIENNLPVRMKRVKILLPFAQAGLANEIRNKGTLIYEEYVAEGLSVEAVVDEALYAKLAKYECE